MMCVNGNMSAILSWAREVSAAVGGAEQERYCTTLEAPAMPTSRANADYGSADSGIQRVIIVQCSSRAIHSQGKIAI